jgi:hypothetical protein
MIDYKKYSLTQLSDFLHDAMNTESSAQEIYDVIKGVVEENYLVYTKSANQARELLDLLHGHRPVDLDFFAKDDEFLETCKVKKWILPVQQKIEDGVDDYYIQFPDDLLEEANLKEGDQIEWIPQNNNSYIMQKVEVKN